MAINFSTSKKFLTIGLWLSLSSTALGYGQCGELFGQAPAARPPVAKPVLVAKALIDKQLEEKYDSPNIKTLKSYNALAEFLPSLKSNVEFNKALKDLLSDESLSTFHVLLDNGFKIIATEIRAGRVESNLTYSKSIDLIRDYLEAKLTEFMPVKNAKERAELIKKTDLNKNMLMQALGKMTQKESLEALVGANGLNNISKESLVGRYLAECKAKGIDIAPFVDSFSMGPGYGSKRGSNKVFIPVDSKTTRIANKYFGNNPHLLIHNHTPNQGTLQMHYLKEGITYAQFSSHGRRNAAVISGSNGAILPIVVLSSVEGSNTFNYFSLGKVENKYAKYPWGLKNKTESNGKEKVLEYCRIGGYTSCTHWMGEAPIGEKFVDKYAMPGYQTDDSYSTSDPSDKSRGLRTTPVTSYNYYKTVANEWIPIGSTTRVDRLTRIVWTGNSGREQLWSLIGDSGEGLAKGEWANPGWVLYSFLSRSTENRVPVVLVNVSSAEAALTRESIDNLKNNISAH